MYRSVGVRWVSLFPCGVEVSISPFQGEEVGAVPAKGEWLATPEKLRKAV